MTRVIPLFVLVLAGCGATSRPALGPEPEEASEDEPPPTVAIALRLEDAGADENETPRTRVVLVAIAPDGRSTAELGVETGACWHVAMDGALITARCWWAGAGAAYAVHREGESIVAHRRDVDEQSDEPQWRESGRLDLPQDAVLEVLAPGRRAQIPD